MPEIAKHLIFDGKGFLVWKRRITQALTAQGWRSTLDGEDKGSETARHKALDYIMSHLDSNVLQLVSGDNPYQLMTNLEERYEKNDVATRVSLKSKLATIKLRDYENAQKYCDDITRMSNEIRATGATVDDDEELIWILNGLPKSYNYIKTAAKASAHLGATVDSLRQLVVDQCNEAYDDRSKGTAFTAATSSTKTCHKCGKIGHIQRFCRSNTQRPNNQNHWRNSYSSGNANNSNHSYSRDNNQSNMSANSSGSNINNNSTNKELIKCFRCNKFGHIGKNCDKYGDNVEGIERKPKTKSLIALVTGADETNENTKYVYFVLDSGATSHLVNDENLLSSREVIDESVNCAKRDASLVVESVGDLFVTNEHGREYVVKDVKYSPNLITNLLSVRKLRANGCFVEFGNDILIRDPTGEIVTKAYERDDGLFEVKFRVPRRIDDSVLVTTDATVWHRRFGHASNDLISKVDGIPCNKNLNISTCDTCAKAKQHRNSCDETRHRADRPLQIIHTDTIGPLTQSVDFESYIVTYLDDYTHYAVTFVLKRRSDVPTTFEDFEKRATAKFNAKLHKIRCDNAPEYVSGDFRRYCDKRGIEIQPAEPYLHEHNGRAERWNRTLMEKTRALLYDANLPVTYWNYAVYAATFIINRLPTTTLDMKTPFEMWNGYPPSYKYLKVFGCIARVMTPYEKRKKLQPKSQTMVLIGYCDTCYALLNPETNDIIYSADVVFDENKNYGDLVDHIEVTSSLLKENLDSVLSVNELTYNDAINGPDGELWKTAINEELENLKKNETLKYVDRKDNVKTVRLKWVFRVKQDGRYKARLVALGYQDDHQYADGELYSPVTNQPTVRTLIVLANHYGWKTKLADVTGAFLYGQMDHIVYAEIPDGMEKQGSKVLLVKGNLYGFPVAPKVWYKKLTETLSDIGVCQSSFDHSLFVSLNFDCIVITYVDDLLISGPNEKLIDEIVNKLGEHFDIKSSDVNCFLNVKFHRDFSAKTITMDQRSYIVKMLEKFGLSDANVVSTPFETDPALDNEIVPNLETLCREMIGQLSFVAQWTRPDITFTVNYLSRFASKPTKSLVIALKRVMRYLKGSLDCLLKFRGSGSKILEVYVDSDYAGDKLSRKSTSGVLVKIFGDSVFWLTRKQKNVSLSSGEAEYVALSDAVREAKAFRNLLEALGINNVPITPIYCDSSAAIAIATTSETRRTRHIDVSYHHTREAITKGEIVLEKVCSKDQLADLFTKAVNRPTLEKLRPLIME